MISKDEMIHLANLAKIEMSEDELSLYASDMSSIIDLMDEIKTVDTSSIDTSLSPDLPTSKLRADVVEASLSNAEALANAPAKEKGLFSVTRVVE